MTADDDTPRAGERLDGAERYEHAVLRVANAEIDLCRDRLIEISGRREVSIEKKIEEVRDIRAELRVVEKILDESCDEEVRR